MAGPTSYDQIGVSNTNVTPANPVQDTYTAKFVERIGEAAVATAKDSIVAKSVEEGKATVEAYSRMKDIEAGGNVDELFGNAPDPVKKQMDGMFRQLKSEIGTINQATLQGKLDGKIAQQRIEDLISKNAQMFPGWKREIADTVSAHLGFNTTGFAARRILGLDGEAAQPDDKVAAMTRDVVKAEYTRAIELYGADFIASVTGASVDELFSMDPQDALERLAKVTGHSKRVAIAENAAKLAVANKSTYDIAYAPKIRENARGITLAINGEAQKFLNQFKALTPEEIVTKGRDIQSQIDKWLVNYQTKANVMIREGDGKEGRIPDDVSDDAIEAQAKIIRGALQDARTILNAQSQAGNVEGLAQMSYLFSREDWYKVMPTLRQLYAVGGASGVASIFKDMTAVGGFLVATGTEMDYQMKVRGFTDPNQVATEVLNRAGNAYRAPDQQRFWLGQPDEERTLTVQSTIETSIKLLEQFTKPGGGVQSDANPSAIFDALVGMDKYVDHIEFNPTQRVRVLRALEDPKLQSVLKGEQLEKYKAAHKALTISATSYIYSASAPHSFAKQLEAKLPYVEIGGQKAPTSQVFFARDGQGRTIPNPAFFKLSNMNKVATPIQQSGWEDKYAEDQFNRAAAQYAAQYNAYAPTLFEITTKYAKEYFNQ
jgi:hypothetical protein